MRNWFGILVVLVFGFACAKDRPFLSGHVRRAHDAIMVPCDPYGLGKNHTCIVFSAAFRENLYVYNATAGEMVLSPMGYFPLKVRVGRSTDHLFPVVSADPKVPFMYALDHNEGLLYPIRLFATDTARSFEEPKSVQFTKAPHKMAAVDVTDKIIGIGTYPDDGSIEIFGFEKTTGRRDPKIASKTVKVGVKPNYIEIDHDRKVAVISDQQDRNIHVLDLANIDDVLMKGAAHTIKTIAVPRAIDRIYLSQRDFGAGPQLYAVLLAAIGNDVAVINVDKQRLEGNVILSEYPMAAYFPDNKSATCCSGKRNWFSVATIKGDLHYIVINNESGGLRLEKSTVVEMTSEDNLVLGKLHVRKIVGGYVEPDSSIDRELLCSSNRYSFYISSYGNSRSYLNTETVEQEAHGYSCEGEASASRFGYKAN